MNKTYHGVKETNEVVNKAYRDVKEMKYILENQPQNNEIDLVSNLPPKPKKSTGEKTRMSYSIK
jgi:hypothetical protein